MQEARGAQSVASGDAFTAALLKYAASNLGVQYTGVNVQTNEGTITSDELEHIKSEIRRREHVLGVDSPTLIPLFLKAGDLAPTLGATFSYYKKSLEVIEANKSRERGGTLASDMSVLSYADLGSRFFQHGLYSAAETVFTLAASICREKTLSDGGAVCSLSAQCDNPEGLRRLRGNLQEWQTGVGAAQQDILALLSSATPNSHGHREMRDAHSQADLGEEKRIMPSLQSMKKEEENEKGHGGMLNARELKGLERNVFDPTSGNDGISISRLM